MPLALKHDTAARAFIISRIPVEEMIQLTDLYFGKRAPFVRIFIREESIDDCYMLTVAGEHLAQLSSSPQDAPIVVRTALSLDGYLAMRHFREHFYIGALKSAAVSTNFLKRHSKLKGRPVLEELWAIGASYFILFQMMQTLPCRQAFPALTSVSIDADPKLSELGPPRNSVDIILDTIKAYEEDGRVFPTTYAPARFLANEWGRQLPGVMVVDTAREECVRDSVLRSLPWDCAAGIRDFPADIAE